jgi:hypothetical protein
MLIKRIFASTSSSEHSKFSVLLPYKTTSSPLTHGALVDIMTKHNSSDFARFVGSLLPRTVAAGPGALHRTLVAFHAGVLLEFVKRPSQKGNSISLPEGTLAWLLPAALEPLYHCSKLQAKSAQKVLLSDVIVSKNQLSSLLQHTYGLIAGFVPNSLSNFAYLSSISGCAINNAERRHLLFNDCLAYPGPTDAWEHLCNSNIFTGLCSFEKRHQGRLEARVRDFYTF